MTSENKAGNSEIASKPAVSEVQASKLTETLYGLQVSKVKSLPSYDDQNFYIQAWDDEDSTQREYILKITNGESSKNAELIEVQTCVMKFLYDEGLPTPKPVSTKTGEIMSLESIAGNSEITSKPAVSEVQASKLTETLYGLQVSKVKSLPSYIDQNFYIQAWDDEDSTQREYILKITNGESSKNAELIEVQTCVMKFLYDEGLPTPKPVSTKTGEIMSLESIDDGGVIKKHMVRLLTYLPGTPAANIQATPDILFDIGRTAATIDETLKKKFQHTYKKSLDRGEYIWNLSNTPLLTKYTYAIKEENLRQKIEGVITQFENSVKQNLKSFRQCINHGDLNDHNLLLEKIGILNGNSRDQYRISGILDFGDMSYGYYVFEVAITIMYMMIESTDPLPVGGYVLAGYESVLPLTKEEKEALFTLVCCRFAQSLVMARYSVLLCPQNEEYLMVTAKTGWKHLMTLLDMGKEVVEKIWEDAARSYLIDKRQENWAGIHPHGHMAVPNLL